MAVMIGNNYTGVIKLVILPSDSIDSENELYQRTQYKKMNEYAKE